MDFLYLLPLLFTIVAVGSYGFYKHAARHTDGTDDIQNATSAQKGLMTAAQVVALEEIGYEEGSWTPGLTFGGASVGMTFTTQMGLYTKVGNTVTISGFILLSAKGSSTGTVLITGLPFTVINTYGAKVGVPLLFNKITFANQLMGYLSENDTVIQLREITEAGAQSNISNADFSDDSYIVFNSTYRAA